MFYKAVPGAIALLLGATIASAEVAPFANGWSINQPASTLNFISVKKGTVMELSRFDTVDGTIDESGNVEIKIPLDAINTGVDLRNVRMRFMLFETFLNPHATISTTLTPAMLDDLEDVGTKTMTLTLDVELNGITKSVESEMLVTLAGTDRVSVSSVVPVVLKVEDFDLLDGIAKLEAAAGVTITPVTAVTYNFAFTRNTGTAPAPQENAALANVALEPAGNLSDEACIGRFEILSRTGNVAFEPNSARLTPDSVPLLREVSEIVGKCPKMVVEVAGHTDSLGDAQYNLYLSTQRAASVVDYLVDTGIAATRLVNRGYGETQPVASNGTEEGRQKNRRIQFALEAMVE